MLFTLNQLPRMFSRQLFLTGFVTMSWVTCAMSNPVIDWVTPPAWLQSQTENSPAKPGMLVTGQAWIATGRGGKALVKTSQEQVEIDENALWEWSGKDDGSGGNAVQGRVRVSTARAKSATAAGTPSGDQPVQLHLNAPWLLALDVGADKTTADRLVQYLRFSGYPVSTAQAVQRASSLVWQIWLEGFMSQEAAALVGKNLRSLAPGIVGATPQRKLADGAVSGTP